ncbi:tRNA synthetases class I, catalytic domain-containing protein [Endogone sp. FLAS-F59071]|nr:tRNA synthetases class I, catalytic domain-containing protein [Endogone sp. FLAS-F59071]|eukprot:RUS22636.1 tRNA synthetases class I, catalytic domain-containing protein [Endogone sp. FLAS-F59071]
MTNTLLIATKASPSPYGILAISHFISQNTKSPLDVTWRGEASLESDGAAGASSALLSGGDVFATTNSIARLLGTLYPESDLYGGTDALKSTLIDQWLDFAQDTLSATDFKLLDAAFRELNHHLTLRSFFVGYQVSLADFVIWGALKSSPVFGNVLKTKKESLGIHLVRWYIHISSLDSIKASLELLAVNQDATKTKTADQGKFDIDLAGAKYGEVVTRFPPEPSGYLHIGHAKAALLNHHFAQTYGGKLIVRFDDTNPSKEKTEFEETIKEDLALIGVNPNEVTHTSDYFAQLYQYALQLIQAGKAYVDDTDQATMRVQRMDGVPSRNRDLSVEENLKRFEEMKLATDFGQTCCLRAKISVDDTNKALRDPVIYRVNLAPHHHTGMQPTSLLTFVPLPLSEKWKVYPTYDFACPIVDSIEGVTHALRTNEYRDRNPQYYWMLEALGLRRVNIWDFSRLNFVYTLLSKRKLAWFIAQGLVTGWDDPRFPTVRGIRRRGLTIEALRQYILMQGASQNTLLLEWDKLWAVNRKIIDPISPRHTAISKLGAVTAHVLGGPTVEVKEMPRHKKNLDLGNKRTTFSSELLLDQTDAKDFEIGEEITLMDWGNAFVRAVNSDSKGAITSVDLELHLAGDFKKTKKKITWLSSGKELVAAVLVDFDYLITKKKLEDEEDVQDVVTPVTEFKEDVVADANVTQLNKGDIIQFERRGYYIVDVPFENPSTPLVLICIPDGKASSTASKVEEEAVKGNADKKPATEKKAKGTAFPGKAVAATPQKPADTDGVNRVGDFFETPVTTKMYKMNNVYGERVEMPSPQEVTKMYVVESVYKPKLLE